MARALWEITAVEVPSQATTARLVSSLASPATRDQVYQVALGLLERSADMRHPDLHNIVIRCLRLFEGALSRDHAPLSALVGHPPRLAATLPLGARQCILPDSPPLPLLPAPIAGVHEAGGVAD